MYALTTPTETPTDTSTQTETPTDVNLKTQQGQNEQLSAQNASNDDTGGIPVLERFGDDSGSVGLGLVALLGSAGGYAGYRKLKSSDFAEQSEDEQYD